MGDIEQIIRLAEMANRNRVFLEKIGAVNEAFVRGMLSYWSNHLLRWRLLFNQLSGRLPH